MQGSLLQQSVSILPQTDRPLTQHHKARKPFQSLPYFFLSVRWQKGMIDLLFSHDSKGAQRSCVSLKNKKKTMMKKKEKKVACVTTSFTTLLIIFINNTNLVLLLVVMQLVCLHAYKSACVHAPRSPMNFISVLSPL